MQKFKRTFRPNSKRKQEIKDLKKKIKEVKNETKEKIKKTRGLGGKYQEFLCGEKKEKKI